METIFGIHAVSALLGRQPERIVTLWVQEGGRNNRLNAVVADARAAGVSMEYASRQQLGEWAPGNHQGVVAQCRAAPKLAESDLWALLDGQAAPLLLVLDGVTDPHNLGACLRTADAAGVHAVIVPRDKAASVTPVVRKVASGAAERLPLFSVTNLARTLDQLKERGVWLVGTAGEAGQTLYQVDLVGPLAIVLGAEGKGLRRLTRERCDFLVHIPMLGSISSLNVSVATGVCLFEAVRQRQSNVVGQD